MCIYRMPRDLSVVRPRSACPLCNAPIAAYDNIPVVSWLLLGGKCRACKASISPRYAIVELLTAGSFVLSYTYGGNMLGAIKLCVLTFLLIGLIFTDAETKLLPDALTKTGMVVGLLFSLLVPVEGPAQFFIHRAINWRLLSLINSVAGLILGSAFILGVALLYEAVRGVEGMGRGDVKLMALIGAFLGMKHTLLVLLAGSLVGSVFGTGLILVVWRKRVARRRKRSPAEPGEVSRARAWYSARLVYRHLEIPFGVFLGGAAYVAALWGNNILDWYWRLYH